MANILIIGGTRFIGPELIKFLTQKGDKIIVFSRGTDYGTKLPKSINFIYGDREKPAEFAQISKQNWDYVYDMCCYGPEHAQALIDTKIKFKHLIFFSTAAVYAKPTILPLNENSKLGEWPSFGDYGTRKAEVEEIYKKFTKKIQAKLTIFRPVYLLGKNNYFDRENYYFSRIVKDRKIFIPGNGKALIQFAFLEETAQIFADYPRIQKKNIETLNIGSDEYISVRGFVELCGEIVNKKPKIVELDLKKYNLKEERFYDDLYPFPNLSLILDNSKLKNECKIHFVSLEKGLKTIYAHWKKNWDGKVNLLKMEKEILEKL